MRLVIPLASALLLSSCLETEERITIHDDGSLHVVVSVEGNVADFAEGHPLPWAAPWTASDETTAAWVSGGGSLPRVAGGDKRRLTVAADFATAADLPRRFAPVSDPYHTAYLERRTELEVRKVGGRTVYVFERRFVGRPAQPVSWFEVEEKLPQSIRDKLSDDGMPDPGEWRTITVAVREAAARFAGQMVRDACAAIYTRGDAGLGIDALESVVARCQERGVAPFSTERLTEAYRILLERKDASDGDDRGPDPLQQLESEMLDGLRQALASALADAGVAESVRHAVAAEFEWWLTAHNHTDDLADEKLEVFVTMPGLVVSATPGAHIDAETVRWKFQGSELRGGDRVLRIVSVVE